MRTEVILSRMEKIQKEKKRKRLIWKIKRELLRGTVFLIGTMAIDLVVLGLVLVEPERMLWIFAVGLCLALDAWLSHIIYERKEKRHEQTDRSVRQKNGKSIDTASDRYFRICADQR